MIISDWKEETPMFQAPEINVIRFDVEDIITVSGNGGAGGDVGSESEEEF